MDLETRAWAADLEREQMWRDAPQRSARWAELKHLGRPGLLHRWRVQRRGGRAPSVGGRGVGPLTTAD